MKTQLSLMVFTDLDGTLIDHETYQWSAAQDALTALKAAKCGVVLASSKTAPEIAKLRLDMGLQDWPAIVENGAGLLAPNTEAPADTSRYIALREALDAAPKNLRAHFTGFGDLSIEGVSALTGLPIRDARLAKDRAFSEPGRFAGSDAERAEFIAYLNTKNIIAQQGGRFLTLSFGGNKADQVKALTADYAPQHTVALGDAPNDIQMLETADTGVVIANPHGSQLPPLKGEDQGNIIRTTKAGPTGWNRAILDLLQTLDV